MSTSSSSSTEVEHEAHEPHHKNVSTRATPEEAALERALSDPTDLPYRTLSRNANMTEYTQETATGTMLHQVRSNVTGKIEKYELVTFTEGDKENPKNWSKAYRWYCTMVVAFTCFVVAFNSAVITADLQGPEETFGVSEEVSLLAITMFVLGFGVGPMAFGSFCSLCSPTTDAFSAPC